MQKLHRANEGEMFRIEVYHTFDRPSLFEISNWLGIMNMNS